MTDDETRELFHRMDLRLERLDTKVDNLEKGLADLRSEIRTKFEGLDTRLNTKAGNWTVGLWGATLAFLLSAVGIGLGVLVRMRP